MKSLLISRRFRTLATLMLAALAGGALTAAIMNLGSGPRGVGVRVTFEAMPERYRELGLSDQQEAAIADILEGARPRTDSILAEALPRLTAVLADVDRQVRAQLTEKQRQKLGALPKPHFKLKRGTTPKGGAGVDSL